MPFETVKDPLSGKNIEIFEGYVAFVKINKLESPDHLGNNYRVGVCVDGEEGNGVWLSWGSYKDEKMFRENNTAVSAQVEDGYGLIKKGAKIRIPVVRNGSFINPRRKNLVILEAAPEAPQSNPQYSGTGETAPPGNTAPTYKKKDNTGMEVGHAAKAAAVVRARIGIDFDDAAEHIHDTTRSLVSWYTKNNNHKLNEFNSGQAAGNAVNCVCFMVETEDEFHDLYNLSKEFLLTRIETLRDYITGDKPPKKEPEQKPEPATQDNDDDDGEDEIPF